MIRIMVFNATFNNIVAISWRSALLVEETGENHRPTASHWQILSHIVESSASRLTGIQTYNVSCYII
jgi:predicted unusual protein kinase regulating ubiquinone biosynthesis (AarF/ABC1/UbiB family)